VPFEMLPTNHMVVRARINDKGPFRLIFDLGSPVTLLGSKAAETSGAIGRDAPRAFLFGMRGEGHVDRLKVGDLTAEDLPVIVMDHPALKALGGMFGRPLDGIIGYTFFARYRTTIDYQAHEMTFTAVDHSVRDLMKELPDRLMGPKSAKTRILTPLALWGLTPGEPDADGSGVSIATVAAGSPADAAGLRPGDVLTSLDGRWTTSVADVYTAASSIPPGQGVPAVVRRDGQELTLTVTPKDGL
jgi:hypothetical protein